MNNEKAPPELKLPCGCQPDSEDKSRAADTHVKWNPYNKVVQCHQCSTVYDARASTTTAVAAAAAEKGFHRVDGPFETTLDKCHGELWMDKDGTANFKWHIEGGDFISAREALVAFINCLQERLAQERNCPYYEPSSSAIAAREAAEEIANKLFQGENAFGDYLEIIKDNRWPGRNVKSVGNWSKPALMEMLTAILQEKM